MLRLACLLALCSLSPSALAATRSYVVVVGNNSSVDPATKPLRYADDDAARFYELFRHFAARIELLAVLDDETQRIHKDLPAIAKAPTKARLLDTLAGFNKSMQKDHAAGHTPILYVIYVGHGHIGAAGGGYVSLLDEPLTSDDLLAKIVAPSKAAYNHLIFDACNSYLLVANRGSEEDDSGPDARNAIRSYVSSRTMSRYPNTGLIMSTSKAKDSHEWSVFQGGVFSQEVRSALAGAADVNADGRIEYSEIEAFLAAANLAVDDPRARIEAYIQSPLLDRNRAVTDLSDGRFEHFLRLPANFAGRFYLEDARGIRYLDANKTAESEVYVALVKSPYYFVRKDDQEAKIPLDARGTVDLGALGFIDATQASRGSVAEAFRDLLFQVPYGPGFYRGYVAKTSATPVRRGERVFPPPGFEPRAANQPLKNPYR